MREFRVYFSRRGGGTYQTPQSVVSRTRVWGGKNVVMLQDAPLGYAAVGNPHNVVSIGVDDVALAMLAGISAR